MNRSNNSVTYEKLIDWGLKGAVGILVPLVIWVLALVSSITAQVLDLDKRVSAIEVTRFTASDGWDLERRLDEHFDEAVTELKDCMNKIQRREMCN